MLCRRKNLQRRSARFFRSSSTDVVFRPTPACFHLLGMENTNQPLQKKKHDCPILIEKNSSPLLQGEFGDRGLQKNHRVTQIEHFLLEIIQILFNTITEIGRCKVATDIFLPTLDNFFYKR